MFLLNVEFSVRVGYGFSNVTFRPSRIFHSRAFSYPSVDTDEQSTWKLPAFLPNIQNVVTNFSCWQCLCTLLGPIWLLYKQLLQYTLLKYFTVTSALLTKFPKKVAHETFSIRYLFSQNCPRKHFCFDAAMFHLNIEGFCKTRPHRSYCFCQC